MIIHEINSISCILKAARLAGKTIGFVPTMGFLHEGHLSLLRQARKENDLTVLSIFVNPIQFGAGEDYEEYPRDLARDAELADSCGCDYIFAPTVKEMYPQGYATFVDVEHLTGQLCGASRPGHFRGVTTVVTKLFQIITPTHAYFGQKDAQQALVIERMAIDLNMDISIRIMPTVREKDGLAMSSRNTYLNEKERQAATILSRSLLKAKEEIEKGERDAAAVAALIRDMIAGEPLATIDYVSIVDTDRVSPVTSISGRVLIALAVRFGKTRLIDNLMMEV